MAGGSYLAKGDARDIGGVIQVKFDPVTSAPLIDIARCLVDLGTTAKIELTLKITERIEGLSTGPDLTEADGYGEGVDIEKIPDSQKFALIHEQTFLAAPYEGGTFKVKGGQMKIEGLTC